MLRLLLLLLLAPFRVLTRPAPSLAGQLVYQFYDGPVIEKAAAPPSPSAVQLVYEFPDSATKLENLAARSNGDILLTAVSKPSVYYLEPQRRNRPPQLLYQFPNATGMTGIVETTPDVFAVVAGNWSTATLTPTPGSFSVWTIDFNSPRQPTVKKIASMPGAGGLNEVAALDGSPDIVLIADSVLGAVWRLNLKTGDHSIAMRNPLFSGCQAKFPLGINGINVFEGMLYFINSAEKFYGRIPITKDGSAAGEVQVLYRVTQGSYIFDDFAMDWAGSAWIATHPNEVTQVTVEGKQRNITADEPNRDMTQPTSVVFGRGSKQEERKLYITTSGSDTVGGQVFSIDTGLI